MLFLLLPVSSSQFLVDFLNDNLVVDGESFLGAVERLKFIGIFLLKFLNSKLLT